MIRVRITTRGKKAKVIPFFDSSEALYLWCHNPTDEFRGATLVELRECDYVDAEWMGCEFVHEGNGQSRCLSIVRAAHAKATENDSGFVITPVIGWVTSDVLPMKKSTKDFSVRALNYDEGIELTNEVKLDNL